MSANRADRFADNVRCGKTTENRSFYPERTSHCKPLPNAKRISPPREAELYGRR
ncbi:hypothetical protein [Prolixibacter bellariivorans]|uniref:hypothetical protein n=1 Tax=Prolixibacter bellariivorans TaxID=314319 RepID=UPI00131EF793|nr:hypothetical protein [Prolixibacter bellariivorans]